MDSITRIGVIFVFYLFIVIMSYFIMSPVAEALFSGFEDSDFGMAEDEKDSLMPNIRTAFTIAMAIMISIRVTWLVTKIFSREPSYSYYRRF